VRIHLSEPHLPSQVSAREALLVWSGCAPFHTADRIVFRNPRTPTGSISGLIARHLGGHTRQTSDSRGRVLCCTYHRPEQSFLYALWLNYATRRRAWDRQATRWLWLDLSFECAFSSPLEIERTNSQETILPNDVHLLENNPGPSYSLSLLSTP
jgi:hypothetical protein